MILFDSIKINKYLNTWEFKFEWLITNTNQKIIDTLWVFQWFLINFLINQIRQN